MLISAFSGCIIINIPAAQTDAPTDAPVDNTEAPATEPPVDPTEAPVITDAPASPTEPVSSAPDVGGGIVLYDGEKLSIDIDCDGKKDTVQVWSRPSAEDADYFTDYFVRISLGNGRISGCDFGAETYALNAIAVIVDCDPYDDRLEILFNTTYEDDYGEVYALRVNEAGNGIDNWSVYGHLSTDEYGGDYFRGGKFFVHDYTDIIGTHGVYAEWSVGGDGLYRCSEHFTYEEDWWEDDEYAPRVIKAMPAKRLNSDGTPGESVTVPVGTIVHPVYSDLETYVVIKLKDGTLLWLEISFPGEPWEIFVFDRNQDYYMELPYAG